MLKILSLIILIFCHTISSSQPLIPLYVPYNPGGVADITARLVLKNIDKLYYLLYRPGGGGQLAIDDMSNKKGMMIVTPHAFFVSNLKIFKDKLRYDPANLQVLAVIGITPGVLACKKSLKFKSIQDIVNYPDTLFFGTSTRGGAEHLNTEALLSKITGKHIIIYYNNGGNKHYLDLLGGHIDCIFGNLSSFHSFLNYKDNVILLSTHNIDWFQKNVPTWHEVFNEEFYFQSSIAIITDRRVNNEFKAKLTNDIQASLTSVDIDRDLEKIGITPLLMFGLTAEREINKYNTNLKKFLERMNLKLDE